MAIKHTNVTDVFIARSRTSCKIDDCSLFWLIVSFNKRKVFFEGVFPLFSAYYGEDGSPLSGIFGVDVEIGWTGNDIVFVSNNATLRRN